MTEFVVEEINEDGVPEVVEYPSFPIAKVVAPIVPNISTIKNMQIKALSQQIKPPHLGKKALARRIEEATMKGRNFISVPKKEIRYKELRFYSDAGYQIKDGKPSKCCGIKDLRILWK